MKSRFIKLLVFSVAVILVAGGFWLQSTVNAQSREYLSITAIPGGTLDPSAVTKFVTPLVKPPAMPGDFKKNKDKYKIAVREFEQQILPAVDGLNPTKVWSYGPDDDVNRDGTARTVAQGGSYFYPAFTIEATANKDVQVLWRNRLVDPDTGNPLPHLLPVDPTLHWANPIGIRNTRPSPADTAYWNHPYLDGPFHQYVGPVPMVVHVHGAHTGEDSDGYPEAWYLPEEAATDPNINYSSGTFFDYMNSKYKHKWTPGTVSFKYPNDQRATTLWYHDHTLGMTRINVYAGPAGFWLIRGGDDDLDLGYVAPGVGDNAFGEYTEIPIAIQDRSFDDNGQLFYPDNRAFFEGLLVSQLQIPFTPDPAVGSPSDVAPIWNPEFFGNMMVVNGQTWPFLEVEQRRYRFRLLNGCNSRFLILDFSDIPDVEVWQIGAEGGFLPAPILLNDYTYPGADDGAATILMGPAERADIIVDFTEVPVGDYVLLNKGPDEPFGGGVIGDDFDPADPASTGQVMLFRVEPATGADNTADPEFLSLPGIVPVTASTTRQLALIEEESQTVFVDEVNGDVVFNPTSTTPFGPTAALLGTYNSGYPTAYLWSDSITENPAVGASETWEIYNFTADAHPIHVHLVQFQVVDRQPLAPVDGEGVASVPAYPTDTPRSPEAWETGWKDTVITYPGEVTRIKMRFDYPGFYVWHCHIVEHEDNEMMRPYHVGPIPPDAPAQGFSFKPIRKK